MTNSHSPPLLICNAEIDGLTGMSVGMKAGKIDSIRRDEEFGWRPDTVINANGGALLPGLSDHHIHLLGTAANKASLSLEHVTSMDDLITSIRSAGARLAQGQWLRATGLDASAIGIPDRYALDKVDSTRPIRAQDRTGALWVLNSLALEHVITGNADSLPGGVERDKAGRLTGRIWRETAWLKDRLASSPPDLASLGSELSSFGITRVTDASVSTTQATASLLGRAHRSGALPQHLRLMSGGALIPCEEKSFEIGELKIVLDERSLPEFADLESRFELARQWNRGLAVHCVTSVELSYCLAAFDTFGSLPGDRIEHGGIIPQDAFEPLRRHGLTIITQPGFIHSRGERYLARVEAYEQEDLYRCGSLLRCDIPVGGSSDSPYGPVDPWLAMRTATTRTTRQGRIVGGGERISPDAALNLYLGSPACPGRPVRQIRVGDPADLCLLNLPVAAALNTLSGDLVSATLIDGRIVFQADCNVL
tara:strand:- start:50111 stop:51550 length:1440 start_codon:yes stop_codon:yes gene_type:complete